jgi:hypothetical protein
MITLAVTAYLLVGFLFFVLRSPKNDFDSISWWIAALGVAMLWPVFIVSLLLVKLTD